MMQRTNIYCVYIYISIIYCNNIINYIYLCNIIVLIIKTAYY